MSEWERPARSIEGCQSGKGNVKDKCQSGKGNVKDKPHDHQVSHGVRCGSAMGEDVVVGKRR